MDGKDYHAQEICRLIVGAVTQITIPKGVIAALVGFWAWLSPNEASLNIIGGLFTLVVLDFITGVRVSLKKGKFLQSKLWGRIIDKVVAYGVLSYLALAIPHYAPGYPMVTPAIDTILALVAGRELVSVLENLSALGVTLAGRIAKAMKIRVQDLTDDLFRPQDEAAGSGVGDRGSVRPD